MNNISEKNRKILKSILKLLIKVIIILLFIILMLTFIFGVHRLKGYNMYPSLKDGDLCITYKLDDYYANDVVTYNINGELKFGRIIAREGDTVDGDINGIILNGARVNEDSYYPTILLNTNLSLPITCNKGEYIILNDYRDDTNDSREYGIITEDMLKGKLIFIFRRREF